VVPPELVLPPELVEAVVLPPELVEAAVLPPALVEASVLPPETVEPPAPVALVEPVVPAVLWLVAAVVPPVFPVLPPAASALPVSFSLLEQAPMLRLRIATNKSCFFMAPPKRQKSTRL
jgi:hypothetical protein